MDDWLITRLLILYISEWRGVSVGSGDIKTSVRIKRLLDNIIKEDPDTTLETIVSEAGNTAICGEKVRTYLGDADFLVLVSSGLAYFSLISSVGYDEFLFRYGYDAQNISLIKIQKIIESIIDEIEKENGEIQSSFLLKAFKIAMTKALMGRITEPAIYISLFCQIFLEMIIREETSEEIGYRFKELTAAELDQAISDFSRLYVEENFLHYINKCVEGTLDVASLLGYLERATNDLK